MVQVAEKVQEAMGEDKLDALVCVAGGWAGGNAASPGVYIQLYMQILLQKIFTLRSSLKYTCLKAYMCA